MNFPLSNCCAVCEAQITKSAIGPVAPDLFFREETKAKNEAYETKRREYRKVNPIKDAR